MNYIDVKIPYKPNQKLAMAYNRAMENTDTNWVLLLDQDVFLCNPLWYESCLEAIKRVGDNMGMVTCVASGFSNRKNTPQRAEIECRTSNIEDHFRISHQLYNKYGIGLEETRAKNLAGYFMLINRNAWENVKFRDMGRGIIGVDYDFVRRLYNYNYKIYVMKGLYVYHRTGVRKMKW